MRGRGDRVGTWRPQGSPCPLRHAYHSNFSACPFVYSKSCLFTGIQGRMMSDRDGVIEQQREQLPDTYELLRTKLALPRQRQSLVPREALLSRLDEGLERKLTLVSAPAGFGKTTLVSEWIATRGELREPPSVAWVSLDAGDNDVVLFWR